MVKKNEVELALIQARHRGEAIAVEFGFTALPVDPFEIARQVGGYPRKAGHLISSNI